MDIRNYFSPISKTKPSAPQVTKEKKRKIIIESDDEEDPLPCSSRKRKVIVSDSDDDLFDVTPKVKISKKPEKKDKLAIQSCPSQPTSKLLPFLHPKGQSSPSKLKPVSVTNYFKLIASSQVQQKLPSKRKVEGAVSGGNATDDDAFERTLQQLDPVSARSSCKDKRKDEVTSRQEMNKGNCSPRSKMANGILGVSAKLSQKIKSDATHPKKLPRDEAMRKSCRKREKKEIVPNEGKTPPTKRKIITPVKETTLGCKGSPHQARTPKKWVTPKKATPKKTAAPQQAALSPKQESKVVTPNIDEQKKQRAMAYRKFLQRTGPRNPGGKPLPEGVSNCLSGLTFVVTGMLETIDREETVWLIRKYGGKVTTSVSRNTSFLVVGDDPGQSKTKKAELLGTSLLDEDGLFQMIEVRSPKEAASATPQPKAEDKEDKGKEKAKLSRFLVDSPSMTLSSSEWGKPAATSCSSNSNKSSPLSPTQSRPPRSSGESQEDSGKDILSSPSFFFSSPSTGRGSSQETEPPSSQELALRGSAGACLWVDKYRPTSLKNIIGQQGEQSNAKKLFRWLRDWSSNHSGNRKRPTTPSPWAKDNMGSYLKAALLSGPPGVGKTTTAYVVCRELEFDVVELNASDTRSKRALADEVAELLSSASLAGFAAGNPGEGISMSRNRVLVMDEVDGMAGNEDRGGMQELIALIKGARTPVICLCNDRNHPKIRSLANHCFELRYQRPRIEQIRGAMMTVCFREGIKIRPESLDQVIAGSNRDVRQVLNHLSLWSVAEKDLDQEAVKKEAKLAKKDLKMGPWDVCTQLFSAAARRDMSIHDKVSLFFHDYSIGPLFVQENYLKVSPDCSRGDRRKLLAQVAKTAQVIADSDIVEKVIRQHSTWSLLPTQAILSSVCPGEYMAGHFTAQVEFPSWLGKNSSRNKFDRIAQEIQTHTRLKISGNKEDVIMDYSPILCDVLVSPLTKRGLEGVREAVGVMTAYDLLREDWDAIVELSAWPGRKDPRTVIESKVKAAFTRSFNKESFQSPFIVSPALRKGAIHPFAKGFSDQSDEDDDGDNDDKDDFSKDAMIKPGKLSQKEGVKKTDHSSSKGKGRGGKGVKR